MRSTVDLVLVVQRFAHAVCATTAPSQPSSKEGLGTRDVSSRARARERSPEHPQPTPIHQRRCDRWHGIRRCHSLAGGNASICPLCWEVCHFAGAVWRLSHRGGRGQTTRAPSSAAAARPGGTRPVAGAEITGLRRLINMPRPGERIVFGTEPLDLQVLGEELTWRTSLPEPLSRALGVDADASSSGPQRARGGDGGPDAGAVQVARMIVGDEGMPPNWHNSSPRRDTKQLVNRLRRLIWSSVPFRTTCQAHALGHSHDADLALLSLPQRMRPRQEETDATFFFRAYELPYDPVAFLAFRLSMMEGRQGRGLAKTPAELTAPWATAACASLINLCMSESTQ